MKKKRDMRPENRVKKAHTLMGLKCSDASNCGSDVRESAPASKVDAHTVIGRRKAMAGHWGT